MTRAFHALSHAHLGEAWAFNIFAPFLFVFLLMIFAHDLWQLLTYSSLQVRIPNAISHYGMYGILVAVATYGILRNIPGLM